MRAVWWMLCLADPSVAGRLALGGGGRSAAAARRLVFTLAPRGECLYESRIGDSHPTGPLLRQFSLYSIANTFAHMLEPYGQFLPRVSCVGNIPRGCAPLGCSLHTPHSVGISPYVTRFAQVLLHYTQFRHTRFPLAVVPPLTQRLPRVFLGNLLEFWNLLADRRVQKRLERSVREGRRILGCLGGHGEPPLSFRSAFVDAVHNSVLSMYSSSFATSPTNFEMGAVWPPNHNNRHLINIEIFCQTHWCKSHPLSSVLFNLLITLYLIFLTATQTSIIFLKLLIQYRFLILLIIVDQVYIHSSGYI